MMLLHCQAMGKESLLTVKVTREKLWCFSTNEIHVGLSIQDVQTKKIIGRGTKRGGLYYVDHIAPGRVHQVRGIVANLDWPKKKFNVKNAFLHGDLEGVYMDRPPGYGLSNNSGKVSRLRKALDGKVTFLIIYVDDVVVTSDDVVEMGKLQNYLALEFEMKDLGAFKYFLGIKGVYQPKPMQNHHLAIYDDQVPTNKKRYQRLVGRIIYVSATRPNIAYAVSVVSQFMHSSSEDHLAAVMRILCYLKKAPSRFLIFRKLGHLDVKGYTDADWASNTIDRHSTSGYFTFIGGNFITWRSKKKSVVARFSAEAEYRDIA
ncbi:hypothetical protein L3X38_027206 [Prunus dulcis]|uniref:Reverse transcriptase Ty1/copia-type domain-containing protein n=1 Tax=Prunus dulcis TaxID=3755 RepID=A0AAD4VME2_PRUDU|nr:hypothetical protein L3X38_027206 [Prunus dulcis]